MLEELFVRAAGGDPGSWQALWAELEVRLDKMIAQPRFLGRFGQREDDRRNIIVEVMARLRADNFRRLQGFLDMRARNPSIEVEVWLWVVAKRVAIDYLRSHGDYIDRRREEGASTPGKLIEPETLTASARLVGERPPITNRRVAQQMLEGAPDEHRRALELWAQGVGFREIGRALAVDEPEKLVRAALERLRRKYR